MTWTNAFDAGTCNVQAYNFGALPNILWEGVLGKGEESPTFEYLSATLQLSVSSEGIVTLSCSDEYNADNFGVSVEPQYVASDLQASAMTMNANFATTGLVWFAGTPFAQLTIAIDGSCSPDPSAYGAVGGTRIFISADSGG